MDLSGNKVSTKGAINLAQMLKSNQCIRVLNLKDNNILDEGGKMLSEVARFNHNIVALRLETNPLNYGIVKEIKGFI